jgi:bifunctional DNA-binding transcriptional regulator/antitoxin component of YhaV-PrlF toxin-antitoxin module
MKEQIITIVSKTDKPETKIKKTVSINFDGKQYFIRIPKKISEYLHISENDRLQITLDVNYIKESKKKAMVVEVIGKKK